MRPHRRRFLRLAAGAVALPAVSRVASGVAWAQGAQAYPARPVRIVLGFAPGGAADASARVIGQWLSERLGQQFVVENRTGASGNIATDAVARAPADGYTLLLVVPAHAINVHLYDKLGHVFLRDIDLVAGIIRVPNVFEVNPEVPAASTREFIAYAKANPGKLSFGSAGIGTTSHVAGELFKLMTGVDLLHVPFRANGPAMTAVLGGQVQAAFADMISSVEAVRAGKLRGLAVTTATRSPALPDLPTIAEAGVPGYEASSWFGLGAPKGTPPGIVERLNSEIQAGLADAQVKARLANVGGTVLPGTPADFRKVVTDETEKWGGVVRTANIKAE
jgi:tripartite-type tricarboxylate transporter receptor subunit TctC